MREYSLASTDRIIDTRSRQKTPSLPPFDGSQKFGVLPAIVPLTLASTRILEEINKVNPSIISMFQTPQDIWGLIATLGLATKEAVEGLRGKRQGGDANALFDFIESLPMGFTVGSVTTSLWLNHFKIQGVEITPLALYSFYTWVTIRLLRATDITAYMKQAGNVLGKKISQSIEQGKISDLVAIAERKGDSPEIIRARKILEGQGWSSDKWGWHPSERNRAFTQQRIAPTETDDRPEEMVNRPKRRFRR